MKSQAEWVEGHAPVLVEWSGLGFTKRQMMEDTGCSPDDIFQPEKYQRGQRTTGCCLKNLPKAKNGSIMRIFVYLGKMCQVL